MKKTTSLADRYRRLLAWYPRDHRERHGEEMLGVLLAGAGERTEPSRKEISDLRRGALRLHARRVVGADGGIDHRDVLAIVSLLGPVMLLGGAIQTVDWLSGVLRSGSPWSWQALFGDLPDAPVWGLWFVVAVLSLARMRRTAAVGAWLGTAGLVLASLYGYARFWDMVVVSTAWMLLGAVVAAALTWSPGPARGWRLVGGARFTLLAMAVMASALLVMKSYGTYGLLYFPLGQLTAAYGATSLVLFGLALVVLVVGAVVAGGVATREGRRAALVLCVPVMVSVLMVVLPRDSHLLVAAAVCYGVSLVVLLGLGGLPRRVSGPRANA
ncbi:hypothetical protein [Actinophytocola oryzae]|uniref:Uncharacterized protein n=1 Tax=Actinophytocola oryzae TaxID=502181 RepID=A0A4V3FRE1_9PSEU|nr:hypothetical protein [Actinophytocola oryzae]TDV43231.1 hypothetical protein CLV71_116165 [Actinophytocola oryzae]